MSISDKITRLNNAKTSIANAITNKGGEVAQGDGFEDFASAIASIPSGSGVEILEGTYTPTSDVNLLTIRHNKGKEALFGYVECDAIGENNVIERAEASKGMPLPTQGYYLGVTKRWQSNVSAYRYQMSSDTTSYSTRIGDDYVRFGTGSSYYFYKGGVEYRYKLYFVDEEE